MSYIRKKAVEGINEGDSFSVSRKFSEQDMIDFAGITKDFNPVHFDRRFSNAKNFNDRICHGLLVGSILTQIGGQIGWLASEMDFKFKKPVYFGDTVECHFTITDLDDNNRARAKALFKNQKNEIVLEACLSGILPGPEEKEIMKSLL
jgi:3-hydroxybutyryl-CoA dehydratase